MKKIVFVFATVLFVGMGHAQKKETLSIFENPNGWKQEVIKFPVKWAPDVKFTGFEELLFAPNWSDAKSDDFWSLVMGWKIESSKALALKEISKGFKNYFDGLMKPNHWAQEFPEPKVFLKEKNNGFTGKMIVFDGFHTGKVITLNISGSQQYSKKDLISTITFRISPKDKTNPIWNQLDKVTIKETSKNLIQLDTSWAKEDFPFPIRFAKNIHYKGIAEVRFPPKGWRDPKHPNFWSYTFAWNLDHSKRIDAQELMSNLEKYFDGLNGVGVNKNMDAHKAVVHLTEIKNSESTNLFIGSIKTFDRFATHKPIKLKVFIETTYCKVKQKTMLFFKLSPKPFEHETWNMLGKIKLNRPECN
ncbi:conserved protein of unknown function [Tenacibaculum sp. 190130A14a]|uniref:Uncharacterized protein n=1 Tax=Tenacibaculum polynesiense TaxID=3137857 RepID=A0ABM9P8X6_9FLAO